MLYELIIRFEYNHCKSGYIYCTDGSFVSPSKFKKSGKEAYGYALDDHTVASLKKSTLTYSWSRAKSYCTECNNGGKTGYCPDKDELRLLHSSIMSGRMKEDLIEAEIYEECNYRKAGGRSLSEPNWWYIWSSSEYDSTNAYYVNGGGTVYGYNKSDNNYVIPFFKF